VRLWDLAGAQPLGGPLPGHRGPTWRIAMLPGMRFATSSEDGTVRIWDVLNPDRACERAAGPHGLEALGAYLGAGEDPIVCVPE
jgi:WD40 repeat protein